jgi:hypothetical protein
VIGFGCSKLPGVLVIFDLDFLVKKYRPDRICRQHFVFLFRKLCGGRLLLRSRALAFEL